MNKQLKQIIKSNKKKTRKQKKSLNKTQKLTPAIQNRIIQISEAPRIDAMAVKSPEINISTRVNNHKRCRITENKKLQLRKNQNKKAMQITVQAEGKLSETRWKRARIKAGVAGHYGESKNELF